MIKRVLVASLAFLAISAHAQFYNSQYDVDAVGVSDAAPDVQSATSPPDPVSVSAASVGIDVATAGAFSGQGLLATSADVTGVSGGVVSAVGSAHFLGSFASGSRVDIGIDFTHNDFASGSGGGDTSLFVTLMNGGATVFSDYLTGSQEFVYDTAAGTIGTLELTLTSEANASFLSADPGGFSTSGIVGVTVAVPEPGTYLLMVAGLVATGCWVRRKSGAKRDA